MFFDSQENKLIVQAWACKTVNLRRREFFYRKRENYSLVRVRTHFVLSFFSLQLSHSLQDGPNAPQYFRLNQLEEECEFVSQKEFAKSKRFKLIQLRDKGVRRIGELVERRKGIKYFRTISMRVMLDSFLSTRSFKYTAESKDQISTCTNVQLNPAI